MAGGMKAVPGRRRLLGALLLLLLPPPLGGAALHCEDLKEKVTTLQEGSMSCCAASHHFCYTNVHSPCWRDIWTRMQIRVNSDRVIRVTQVGSEEELRELEESKVWNFLSSLLKEKLNSTNIDVDLYSNKTCLKVELLEDGTKYCI
ncbi:hypothetical protein CIB84_016990, partial [Bambusicola thoracicus]